MYNIYSSHFVISYDPKCIEQHSDSSGFDDTSNLYVSKRKRRKLLPVSKLRKCNKVNKERRASDGSDKTYSVESVRHERAHSGVTKIKQTKKRQIFSEISRERLLNSHSYETDNKTDFYTKGIKNNSSFIVKTSSKFFNIHQIFPYISNRIQSRENYVKNKYHNSFQGDPYCANIEKRCIKKLSRERYNYAMQNYDYRNNIAPVSILNNRLKCPDPNIARNLYPEYIFNKVASTDSEITNISSKIKNRKNIQKHILKEDMKNMSKRMNFKHKKQQFPSNFGFIFPFKFIANPMREEINNSRNSKPKSDHISDIPSTSSGFWDYVINKIVHNQNKEQQADSTKLCPCKRLQQFGKCKKIQVTDKAVIEIEKKQSEPCKNSKCTVPKIDENIIKDIGCKDQYSNEKNEMNCFCKDVQTSSIKFDRSQVSLSCKCHSEKLQQSDSLENNNLKLPNKGTTEKPCQAPHDEIIKTVKQQYNGEILCIHNPRCILINGCLNLPESKAKPTTTCWPVTQVKKSNVFNVRRKIRTERQKFCEQINSCDSSYASSSHHQLPLLNYKELKENSRSQKQVCELVQLCYKPKYSLESIYSYFHVPKCGKSPKYLEGKRADHHQNTKYSQVLPLPKKNVFLAARTKVTTPLRSESNVLSSADERTQMKSPRMPVYHKNKLLRMIQVNAK